MNEVSYLIDTCRYCQADTYRNDFNSNATHFIFQLAKHWIAKDGRLQFRNLFIYRLNLILKIFTTYLDKNWTRYVKYKRDSCEVAKV